MAKLHELQTQRELVARHLAWLDAEIRALQEGAQSTSTPLAPSPVLPKTAAPPTPSPKSETLPLTDIITEQVLEQYQHQAAASPADARKGCLTLFGTVLALLTLGIVSVYFLKYHNRSAEQETPAVQSP